MADCDNVESPYWAEAELSNLEDIPVVIVQRGEVKNKSVVGIEVVVNRAGDTHFITAKEVKEIILNEKVSPVPEEMKANPDSCRLILCREQEYEEIPDSERIRKYGRALAQHNSYLAIADAESDVPNLKLDLSKLAVKTK